MSSVDNSAMSTTSTEAPEKRIWMDGVFDLMHFGHANAFRQGRELGTSLVVGVNSDESVARCKGKPVMSHAERVAMVKSCRYVDEVVEDVPYVMSETYIRETLLEKLNIDLIVHGDDPCNVDGEDVYATAKALGRYRTIPRTEGISTTDVVSRIHDRKSHGFLAASHVAKFAASLPTLKGNVVYVSGVFDLFHCGHVDFLRRARLLGDALLVGVLSRGKSSIQAVHERVLGVLGCRYVDDVVLDAPDHVTEDLIDAFHISHVVAPPEGHDEEASGDSSDVVVAAKNRGISVTVLTPCPPGDLGRMTTKDLVARVQRHSS